VSPQLGAIFFIQILKMKNSILFLILFFASTLLAHPSPNTLVFLDIKSNGVAVELRLPVGELAMALNPNAPKTAEQLLGNFTDSLKMYLTSHIEPLSMDGKKWSVAVGDMALENVKNAQERGTLQDIIVKIWLTPPSGASSRQFILNYDVVMHQVVTHSALVAIRQDWETGIVTEHPAEIGIIAVEPRNNQVFPLIINLESKGLWGGFKSMVSLGMAHISAGIDHLLFLLVLLLPAPLLVSHKKWGQYSGLRYSLLKLIKIITAFTVGHSLTLLLGTVGLIPFSSKMIEIGIAFSILISAIHALKPIFYQKEIYIAAGFGLIHGLAFSDTLTPLHLDAKQMSLSILGFNIGIELMQLGIMAVILPSFILLSQTKLYSSFRIIGAIAASITAVAWIFERVSHTPNFVTVWMEKALSYAPWFIVFLAIHAVLSYFYFKNKGLLSN
jgi:HupE / UreJ protein